MWLSFVGVEIKYMKVLEKFGCYFKMEDMGEMLQVILYVEYE